MIRSLEGQFLQFIVFYCYKQLLLKLVDTGNLLANPKLGGGGGRKLRFLTLYILGTVIDFWGPVV